MIKNYKLALIWLLVSCSILHAMEGEDNKRFSNLSMLGLVSELEKSIKDYEASPVRELLKNIKNNSNKGIKLKPFLLNNCIEGIRGLTMTIDSGFDMIPNIVKFKSLCSIGCCLVDSGMIDVNKGDLDHIEKRIPHTYMGKVVVKLVDSKVVPDNTNNLYFHYFKFFLAIYETSKINQ